MTEAVTGFDLVEWQLRARGERFSRQSDIRFSGHAIEARGCAPKTGEELPAAGRHDGAVIPAEGVRTDHALSSGAAISPLRLDDRE